MAQKPWIVPIPGTRSLDHLSENVSAANVALTSDDLHEIGAALSTITVRGGRMNKDRWSRSTSRNLAVTKRGESGSALSAVGVFTKQ